MLDVIFTDDLQRLTEAAAAAHIIFKPDRTVTGTRHPVDQVRQVKVENIKLKYSRITCTRDVVIVLRCWLMFAYVHWNSIIIITIVLFDHDATVARLINKIKKTAAVYIIQILPTFQISKLFKTDAVSVI